MLSGETGIMSASPRRSALYMPAVNERALVKVRTLPVDMILIDLEDSVAPEAKAGARIRAIGAIREGGFGQREVILRLNGPETPHWNDDLSMLSDCGPEGILFPKINEPDDVTFVNDALNQFDTEGKISLWLMMETPSSVLYAREIAETVRKIPRLQGFVIGTNDLVKDTGVSPGGERANMLPWLMTIVAAAKANGLAVLDGVYNNLSDAAGFARECAQGRALGMTGKTLIHPGQLETCNAAFSPSPEEITHARLVVKAFEDADAKDKGVIVVDGAMVERLHLELARSVLARAAGLERASH
jgi:citrate lyase subunit beta/citryl-CoA lyase